MSPSKAIFSGAIIIAVSVIFINGMHSAKAYEGGPGPYQLMQHSNTTANAGVFRIDTNSGEVSYCYVVGSGQVELTCTKSVK